jgi:AraC-like DNA-binding protein
MLADDAYMVNSLGKSWQPPPPLACKNATEPRVKREPARGILVSPDGVENGRLDPSNDLADFVEHYWWVTWNVPAPTVSEVLSYPSVHVVFEGSEARVVGVVRGRFTRRLEGRGEVFGIKFRPGMFRPLCAEPVVALTNRSRPLAAELGAQGRSLSSRLWRCDSVVDRAKLAEEALREVAPERMPKAVLARDVVERIRSDSELRSVALVSAAVELPERSLQRLFRECVGVSPKWVVRRFRLQEAAQRLATTEATVATVASELGYFDQAHFVRDFKSVVGRTPVGYARETSSSRKRKGSP